MRSLRPGRTFSHPRQVFVYVLDENGVEHGFLVEGGTVSWEFIGMASSPTLGHGSAARIVVEGRMHRKDRGAGALVVDHRAEIGP